MSEVLKKELTDEELVNAAGGNAGDFTRKVTGIAAGTYLAVRSEPYFDDKNIIAALALGDVVTSSEQYATGKDGHTYVLVKVNCKAFYGYKAYSGVGYVNAKYLTPAE